MAARMSSNMDRQMARCLFTAADGAATKFVARRSAPTREETLTFDKFRVMMDGISSEFIREPIVGMTCHTPVL